jgi:hypothetical protein
MCNTIIRLSQLEQIFQGTEVVAILKSPCFQLEKLNHCLFPEIFHVFLHELKEQKRESNHIWGRK